MPDNSQAIPQNVRTIFLDMTDLMDYAKHNSTLSGIQRVVGNLLINIYLWRESCSAAADIVPVIPEYDRYKVLAPDLSIVVEMIDILETQNGDRRKLDKLISAVYNSRSVVYPGTGDIFVIAGAFWIYPHYDLIAELRARGVGFGLFIHDLIQVTNPDYVQHVATVVFRKALIDALALVNFVLTNSEFVAQEVRNFLANRLNYTVPVRAIPLATELRPVKSAGDDVITPDIRRAVSSEYVLCVGTIEIRKNHLYLLKIWDRLILEFDGEVPNLVFVGKWGWKIDELRTYLDRYSRLGDRLRIFNNASDVALAHLYRNCLFTAYPSFAEGFGLPLGESLAYGKPCVVSNTTSLPEVGGRFARYLDPFDLDQGYEVFRSILSDRVALEKWTDDIRANYKPKTWDEFSREFFDSVVALYLKRECKEYVNNCFLEAKTIYFIGDDDVARLDRDGLPLVTFRMARVSGWHPTEPWGCWAAERRAQLKFRTRHTAGTKVSVFLLLHVPPGSEGATCTVTIGGVETLLTKLSPEATWRSVTGVVSENECIEIGVLSNGTFGEPDRRRLYVGIHALAHCNNNDVLTRVSFSSRPARRVMGRFADRIGTAFSLRRRTSTEVTDAQRQVLHSIVEEQLAEREIAAQPQSLFYHVTQAGGISGPYQIVPPNPGVIALAGGPYMAAANCLARDFYHERYVAFCQSISHPPHLHRELWEFAFIAEHLDLAGALRPGSRGLGFGAGVARLPSLFASLGCEILATSVGVDTATARLPSEQEEKSRDALFYPDICGRALFDERVKFRFLNNYKVDEVFQGHDFCWSASFVDKLGSLEIGSEFIVQSVEKALKLGGVACHTSELNLTSNEKTVESGGSVLFRRRDIEDLIERLERRGHEVKPLAFEAGLSFLDTLVDVPPFDGDVHLKLRLGEFVTTSFGIVVTRGR